MLLALQARPGAGQQKTPREPPGMAGALAFGFFVWCSSSNRLGRTALQLWILLRCRAGRASGDLSIYHEEDPMSLYASEELHVYCTDLCAQESWHASVLQPSPKSREHKPLRWGGSIAWLLAEVDMQAYITAYTHTCIHVLLYMCSYVYTCLQMYLRSFQLQSR